MKNNIMTNNIGINSGINTGIGFEMGCETDSKTESIGPGSIGPGSIGPGSSGPGSSGVGRLAASLLVIAMAGVFVSGCSDVRRAIGEEKSSPDEFEVVIRAPLSLPPGFASKSSDIVSGTASSGGSAGSETGAGSNPTDARSIAAGTLQSAEGEVGSGYDQVFNFAAIPENIRDLVDEETLGIQFERRLPLEILFGGLPDIGPVLDKMAEDQRLRANFRKGLLATEGPTYGIDDQTDEPVAVGK
jgi:hypothetical protein